MHCRIPAIAGDRLFVVGLLAATIAFSPSRASADPDSSLLRGCVAALSLLLSGIPNTQPERFFRRPIDPTVVQVPTEASNPAKARRVTLVKAVTAGNAADLFAHQYNEDFPTIRGAKGLVFHGFDGQIHVVMWPTGSGRDGNEVHHTDVAASILRHEAALLRKAAEGPVFEREFARSAERLERESSLTYLKMATDLEALAKKLHQVRKHDAMPDALLQRFQGFQMSAQVDRSGRVLGVTKLEISSRLTAAQASKGVRLQAETFNRELDAIYAAVSPELRRWKRVEVEAWDQLNFDDRNEVVEPGTRRPPLALVR